MTDGSISLSSVLGTGTRARTTWAAESERNWIYKNKITPLQIRSNYNIGVRNYIITG